MSSEPVLHKGHFSDVFGILQSLKNYVYLQSENGMLYYVQKAMDAK